MKRKTIGLMLALMTVTALTSCGTKETMVTEAIAMESNVTVTEETGLIVEDASEKITLETEELIYTEYEDLFLADNYLKAGREKLEAVDENSIESTYEKYALSDTVDVYNFEGTWLGYSKPDIEVILFGTNDKWAEVSFLKTILYVPKDIFDSVATPKAGMVLYRDEEETETESSAILLAEVEESTPKQEITSKPKTEKTVTSTSVVAEPSTTESVAVEPEPVVDNTKYTPEEAIAVYRSIMESNGIQWDPSIKSFASWGTGWIYLDKGQPEWAANSAVEVYKLGGGDITRPWTHFYVEMSSSDSNAVYITEWNCD